MATNCLESNNEYANSHIPRRNTFWGAMSCLANMVERGITFFSAQASGTLIRRPGGNCSSPTQSGKRKCRVRKCIIAQMRKIKRAVVELTFISHPYLILSFYVVI
jgi:hypothetical protein